MRTRALVADHLAALCDFVAGTSIRSIARRFGWTISVTEQQLRRAFSTYGVGPAVISRLLPDRSAGTRNADRSAPQLTRERRSRVRRQRE